MAIELHHGDCLQVMRTLPTASVDAIVTDPPAGIGFMSKEWDDFRRARNPADSERENVFGRTSRTGPEYGRARDAFVAFLTERMAEALRVIKPCGYALVWAIPRTSHWTALALEDAGWEIRDRVSHIFGSGFPKNQACLKPAVEDWWLCRAPGKGVKPLPGLDACRIGTTERLQGSTVRNDMRGGNFGNGHVPNPGDIEDYEQNAAGRWPANLCLSHHESCVRLGEQSIASNGHFPAKRGAGGNGTAGHLGQDGLQERHMSGETVEVWQCVEECPIRMLDEQAGDSKSSGGKAGGHLGGNGKFGAFTDMERANAGGLGDTGGPSRFFYCPKASRSDRGEGNNHPTVKNTELMRWLIKLITPFDGVVLDPFLGSGSTAVACSIEGFSCIGIEQDAAYLEIAKRRIAAIPASLFT